MPIFIARDRQNRKSGGLSNRRLRAHLCRVSTLCSSFAANSIRLLSLSSFRSMALLLSSSMVLRRRVSWCFAVAVEKRTRSRERGRIRALDRQGGSLSWGGMCQPWRVLPDWAQTYAAIKRSHARYLEPGKIPQQCTKLRFSRSQCSKYGGL